MTLMENAAERRINAILSTSEKCRNEFAQHLTPEETAVFAASMFSDSDVGVRCLDMGAGTGMLSAALVDRYGSEKMLALDCVEIDPILARICDAGLAGIEHRVVVGDALVETPHVEYDRVILNPPYKKMASGDWRQRFLPVHASNLYSAFVSVALSRLAVGGECVAIIPRSWMNGYYFARFREWVFESYSLDAFHVYESRKDIFSDTDVLQEIMIVRFSNKSQSHIVEVSQSNGNDGCCSKSDYPFDSLVGGESKTIRIAPSASDFGGTISERGFCPSTGKVVDFRSRDRIYKTLSEAFVCGERQGSVYPLIYAGNLRDGFFSHPEDIGKGQWFRADDQLSEAQLIQPGSYVLVKRFSSKEESKRVVACPISVDGPIAIENHLNFIHEGTSRKVKPLSSGVLANGIALWLNSTLIDAWFRDIGGSTQVNAGDIKAMPCPSAKELMRLGSLWHRGIAQEEIDEAVKGVMHEP